MYFRNLTFFRFPLSLDLSDLDAGLAECALKPAGALEISARGFVSPFGRESDVLLHRLDGSYWVSSGSENKILPGAVVNDLLVKKLAEIEAKNGRKLGGRARKNLKEDLVHELLPRAFVRPGRTDTMIDSRHGFIAIDTSSRKTAELVVSDIRHALGSFPALPLNAEVAPRSILTAWVAGEPLPQGLSLGDECELRDPTDHGGVVKCQRQEMLGDEIAKHLESGKQVSRLALTLNDHVSFVLGADLTIRKLKFLDGALDQLESCEHEDIHTELRARFALFSGEVRRLFLTLEPALKLSKAE